jgi:hypothetical protein
LQQVARRKRSFDDRPAFPKRFANFGNERGTCTRWMITFWIDPDQEVVRFVEIEFVA